MSKWRKFHSQYSPVVAGSVNKGSSALQEDWVRVGSKVDQEKLSINGTDIGTYRKEYNGFKTDKDVETFFREIILKDMKSDIDKDKVIPYLVKAFHQGGLLYPVSASMANLIDKEFKGLQPFQSETVRDLQITTNKHGFTVQEIYTVKKFITSPDAPNNIVQMLDEDGIFISPDKEKDFIIDASASIDVDFSAQVDNPKITVKANYISYGHEGIKEVFDKRHLGQIIVDFFRNILGLNSVKEILEVPALENVAKESNSSEEVELPTTKFVS